MYVDDILLVSNSQEKLSEVKQELNTDFETLDLREIRKLLGMEIVRDRTNQMIVIHQTKLIEAMLRKFNMTGNTQGVTTPMATHDAERKQEQKYKEKCNRKIIPFRHAVGNLMYMLLVFIKPHHISKCQLHWLDRKLDRDCEWSIKNPPNSSWPLPDFLSSQWC